MSKQLPDIYFMALEVLSEQSDGTPNRNSSGVTVASNGVVYTGDLVSEEAWLKEVLETVLSSDTAGANVLKGIYSDARDRIAQAADKEENDGKFEEFVHLVNAKLMVGGTFDKVGPVRIKKSSISAWSFGVFS